VLGSGGVLDILCNGYHLTTEFRDVYNSHYTDSISFIDAIVKEEIPHANHEFYVSSLAINELFYAIKDELRSIILFNKGMPISRWRDARTNPDIPEKCFRAIYNQTLLSFDTLLGEGSIIYLPEGSAESDPEYWSIYAPLLFLTKDAKTQDATLLTTAILNRADYFVTKDEPLIKAAKKQLLADYQMELVKPSTGLTLLKKQTR
jgi:hypothetical protein